MQPTRPLRPDAILALLALLALGTTLGACGDDQDADAGDTADHSGDATDVTDTPIDTPDVPADAEPDLTPDVPADTPDAPTDTEPDLTPDVPADTPDVLPDGTEDADDASDDGLEVDGGDDGGAHPRCAARGGICTEFRWEICPVGTEPAAGEPREDCPGMGWCCVPAPDSTCSSSGYTNCIEGRECTGCWGPPGEPTLTCEAGRVCCFDMCD